MKVIAFIVRCRCSAMMAIQRMSAPVGHRYTGIIDYDTIR